ncbi:hypothetical protein J2W28_005608 [Variovorax boronicumulans]|uniref:hypothetical protein n=1 Tax=Variovorax boronicumulans TaxID=436515 RepID=UPI0027825AE2|nr:hypothetical protein [Variovorax boronicumulans]MDP9995147.1 hypothetical protein [Variovorax boronicumulans]MDQ0006437.1 hypothetical protein [Variovorax boronicumulans]
MLRAADRLPEDSAVDPERRAKADLSKEVHFATKTLVALQRVSSAVWRRRARLRASD